MKNRVCNPYLPLYEYIPDGEPRVFGDRLYVYGSHDRSGGDFFCMEDYVVWSAPVDDLSDWRYEGVSYRKDQDSSNRDGKWELFAPDVVCGPDGRYYLFYCLRMQQEFGVAVSDKPEGPFAFYGHIHYADGTLCREYMPYDPAVLVDDDGKVYLYYGYTSDAIAAKFGATVSKGCMVIELEQDMLTICAEPSVCLPKQQFTDGTGFEGHGYYEAPSIRKIDSRYYLVYSSEVCHELCYAVSDSPTEGYEYGGVIVSNGDIGLEGRRYPVCMPGNNHGGIVKVQDQYYIFYQRHTQCTQFSRQGVAERITIRPDGSIPQVEVTTSGIYGDALTARGSWSGAYACQLYRPEDEGMLNYREASSETFPCIWEDTVESDEKKRIQYIRNITDSTIIGYKYFRAEQIKQITCCLRGTGNGCMEVRLDDPQSGTLLVTMDVQLAHDQWTDCDMTVSWDGVNALYFIYHGKGSLDLKNIRMC